MIIELKKFGTTLTSRQQGKESFAAFLPILREAQNKELITVVFEGITTLSPSWGDEFLTGLHRKYGENLILKKSENPSVNATIRILEETNEIKFNIEE